MKDKIKKKILIASLGIFIFLIWGQREIFIVNKGFGYKFLELTFTVFSFITLSLISYYLLIKESKISSHKTLQTGYLGLLVVQTVAFLPLYTQTFMYGDDLWGYSRDFDGSLSGGIYYSRPFVSFLNGFLVDTSFKSINNVRIFCGLTLFLFGCVMFRFMVDETKNVKRAWFFAVLSVAGCAAVDCIAYASVYPINASLLISAISFITYLKAMESENQKRMFYLCISIITLVSAFCMYQVGTPIVFLMYIIHEKYNGEISEKKRCWNAFKYLIFYGITAILYLLLTKIIQILTDVEAGQSARSTIVFSIDDLVHKGFWFITDVCPQSLRRIIAFICGNKLFEQNNMFYQCTFSQKVIGIFLTVILFALIVTSIVVNSCRKKSIAFFALSIVCIPLSFWPFLILPESTYLTYYAMAIILLFTWYIWDAVCILVDFIKERKLFQSWKLSISENGLLAILIVIIALQSNNYAENSWVNYNRDSYEYLANTIAAKIDSGENIDTITVQGSISPYVGGREYVIFAVKDILIELERNPDDYNIIQSDNSYYISIFNDNELDNMTKILGKEKINKLLNYYMHDDMYSRWYYVGNVDDREALDFLQSCFIATGQLVLDKDNTISINMEGFNKRNKF